MNDRNRKTDTNEIDSRKQPLWYSGRYFDYPMFGIVLGLVLFGLVMVYSTSSYRADELYGDSTYFAKRQLVFELVALVGMFLVSKIDYRRYARYSKYFLYVAIALLLLVYIIGSASHGSTRWIYIGAFGFQPSEFAKLALIVYTADICTRKPRSLNTIKGLAKMLLLPLITIVLIAIENLSTAIIEDFAEIEKDFPNFHFHLALDRPDPAADAAGVKYTAGFVHNVMYETYLKDHDAPEDIKYFMCGPPMMVASVNKLLDSLGVQPESILYDNFS